MLEKIWVINGKVYILQDNKHCTKCKDYMNCNWNHIGLGSGNWAKECMDYQPKKLQVK